MLRSCLVALALVCGLTSSAWADGSADAGIVEPVPAGSAVEVAVAPSKVEAVANPARSPVAAWDDVKAARKTSWPLAVWLVLVMLGKALAYGRDKLGKVPLVGKLAAVLAKGKGAMILAAVGAVGAAGYEVLLGGGSWVAALVASGAALGGVISSTTRPATAP